MSRFFRSILKLLSWVICLLSFPMSILAGPVSNNYELKNYGFGTGGTENSTSDGFQMQSIAGEQSGENPTSDNFQIGSGLVFTTQANLPQAPTFTNPGGLYDRLKLVINNGGNTTDAQFAVTITSDSWITTRYIQDDFTIGDTLGTEDWQTYTQWGSATGIYVTGLSANTTYTVRVKARHGNFTETGWSAEDSAATSVPSLTFSVSADTITFDQLSSANSWTDSNKSTTLTTSTNAYNGYTVYGHETTPLTNTYSQTIADFSAPNSLPTVWAGTGFGYTTDDSLLGGGAVDRFTSGGPKYAGLTTSAPGDPVADHTDTITTPIVNEQFTLTYRVTASENQGAGKYNTTLIYIVVPEY